MRSATPDIPILGVPLQWWITLPVMVICLYAVFRWRRFGEDAYTWNHEYFKLALTFATALCALTLLSTLWLPERWEQAALWAAIFVATGLTLRFSRHQDWANTAVLSVAIIVIGLGSVALAGTIRHALFRPVKWGANDPLAGVPRSTFSPVFPPGWQEQPGLSPHAYKRGDAGSGVLQVSLLPPPDGANPTGAEAEKDLSDALDSVAKGMDLGQRVSISHEDATAGPMAFADYQTNTHGPVRFWMILSEARIFASYTDGKSPTAEREIGEAQAVLKSARFKHFNSP